MNGRASAVAFCCLPALGFFALDSFFRAFDFGWGWLRVLVLVALAVAVYGLRRAASVRGALRRLPASPVLPAFGLIIAASVVGGGLLGRKALRQPPLSDQSDNTVVAVRAVAAGANPYGMSIDPDTEKLQEAQGNIDLKWLGYKYGPATIALYAPLVLPFGEGGIVLTNCLAMAAIGAALALLLRRLGTDWGLALALAAAPFGARYMAFVIKWGETDPPAVALGLWGLWAALEKRQALAGALLGASCCAKLLPGAIYLVALWPLLLNVRAVGGILASCALFAGLAVWADPGAFARSILIFPFTREPDSTGLPYFLSPALRAAALLLGAAVLARTLLARERDDLAFFWRLLVAHVVVLSLGNYFHNNYLVWLYPVLGLTLGALLLASPRAVAQEK